MKKTDKYIRRMLVAIVIVFIITAPYAWWDKAKEDRDRYKAMYEATQSESKDGDSKCELLLPPIVG